MVHAIAVETRTHHDVELAKQGEFLQVARRLAICMCRLPQVLDGPDDGEKDGAAADDVNLTAWQQVLDQSRRRPDSCKPTHFKR